MNWSIVNTIVGIVQIVVSIVLIASVLMQSAKKEGMSGIVGGASETFFGKNKSRTLDSTFATITTICAILFLITSLFLSYGMIAIEKSNTPETEITTENADDQEGIQVTMDEEGNLVNPETGEIVMTAEEFKAQQEAAAAEAENADAENSEGENTEAESSETTAE